MTACNNHGIIVGMRPTTYATRLPGLRQYMRDRNMSVVAETLGIHQSTLSLIVNCHRGASIDVADKLARYFETTIEALKTAPETDESSIAVAYK